ncbi:MAG: hypothetical protein AB1705_17955 [Verrucomicrobiota bacterium]
MKTLLLLMLALSLAGAQAAEPKAKAKKAAPAPSAAPKLMSAEPRGVQRGVATAVKLTGANLNTLKELKLHNAKLTGKFIRTEETKSTQVSVELTAAADLPRAAYELSVVGERGESEKLKVYVDDLPQAVEPAMNTARPALKLSRLPASAWGVIEQPGVTDEIEFEAKAGQTIVLDFAVKSVGSKMANPLLTVIDVRGVPLAGNHGVSEGGDPLVACVIPATGVYRARVSDQMLGGSADHFYRLSIGELPTVTGFFPLSVHANSEAQVQLVGYNLGAERRVAVKAGAPGEMPLPIDRDLYRTRENLRLIVSDQNEALESEPNDLPSQATSITVPAQANGRLWRQPAARKPRKTEPAPSADADLYRFSAKAGQVLVIETTAARRGSPLDTKIEVLHANGSPVERVMLQAVRDSSITFRNIDSVQLEARCVNWEEMDLNQYLYMQGEVVKIYRMPRGPDSGFMFYTSEGKRRGYFDTSATAHALDEPCYIVEPHPPGTKLLPNGLPAFMVHYENDDDADRKLGKDSRLFFTAPQDGGYLVRVTDTRGVNGEEFVYRLTVREAKPDFKVTLQGANPTVNAGAAKGFTVKAERIDGFDGEIRVSVTGAPPGFIASPTIIIQAGHLEADGSLFAAVDAPQPTTGNRNQTKVTAAATINGQTVTRMVNNLGDIKLAEKPKLMVTLAPDPSAEGAKPAKADQPLEIVIAPGQTVPAWLRLERNGDTNLVNLDIDGLPHGIIIDNIGLNGVQIRAGENEREIFLTAAKWVPETERLCHAVFASARGTGGSANLQTSNPVLIRVRKGGAQVATK